MSEDPLASTAERTLRLVELLLGEADGLTPQEMIQNLGISRSSLFVLLRTLKALGYVEQIERRGRYRSGPRLLSWRGAPADQRQDLVSSFYQEAGRREWAETLLLVVPAGEGHLVLGQIEGTQPVRCVYDAGEVNPDLAAARQLFAAPPAAAVLDNGCALEEREQLYELAVPICPDGVRPEAALLLGAPAYRWTAAALLEQWLPELRIMAARLSYRLGAPTYTPYRYSVEKDMPAAIALSPAEISAFLQGPWTARLACIRPDGRPHVIPVWQEWDGHAFTMIAWQGSQWAEFVRHNANVSLTIDEPWPPLRRITARGQAAPLGYSPGSQELESLVQRLAQRYLGNAGPYPSSGQVQSAYRIRVESLRGWQGLPGAAGGPHPNA
ncbi:MAG: helix-turn-helix domain-containing protein [Anaerolineaceae bacterium]|nr:helix-turn-helix domain-containing protein [Anaerolineaceae bacterium]